MPFAKNNLGFVPISTVAFCCSVAPFVVVTDKVNGRLHAFGPNTDGVKYPEPDGVPDYFGYAITDATPRPDPYPST